MNLDLLLGGEEPEELSHTSSQLQFYDSENQKIPVKSSGFLCGMLFACCALRFENELDRALVRLLLPPVMQSYQSPTQRSSAPLV